MRQPKVGDKLIVDGWKESNAFKNEKEATIIVTYLTTNGFKWICRFVNEHGKKRSYVGIKEGTEYPPNGYVLIPTLQRKLNKLLE